MVLAPPWLLAARKEVGTREEPGNQGPAIQRYIDLAHCGALGQPWCAIFVNAMLESSGVKGSRSAAARSFCHNPDFAQLPGPALGAIVSFWRISRVSGLGHVGFYNGEDSHGFINTLSGNDSDMVRNDLFNPHAAKFGLIGYYWPKGVELPVIQPWAVSKAPPTTANINFPQVT